MIPTQSFINKRFHVAHHKLLLKFYQVLFFIRSQHCYYENLLEDRNTLFIFILEQVNKQQPIGFTNPGYPGTAPDPAQLESTDQPLGLQGNLQHSSEEEDLASWVLFGGGV